MPVGVSLAGIALGARPSPDADHCLGKYLPITTFVNGSSSSQCNSVKPNSRPSIGSDPIVPIAAGRPSSAFHRNTLPKVLPSAKMFAVASRESAIDVGCALVPFNLASLLGKQRESLFGKLRGLRFSVLRDQCGCKSCQVGKQPQVSGRAWLHRFHRCPIERKEICGGLHCIDNQSTQQAI